ncbi:DUF4232 domain-containing protein [Streptomyces sp. NPDC058257]|uniref:DUF4232 domain-containing protein n=1 Tax=Streptomyces sp. NPDC058257 TaxID=3346409 RepID=UPI0036E4FAF7
MRAKTLTLAAVALAASLSLTACQGDKDSDASGAGSGSGSGSSSSSSSGGSSGGSSDGSSDAASGSSTSDENAKNTGGDSATTASGQGSGGGQVTTGNCKTANLSFSASHGMAEGDLIVSLKNKSDTCSLKGFPGVDLRSEDASGPLSAERSKLAAPAVVLNTGETTRFTLHTPTNDGTGEDPVYVSAIDVTPPNETHSKALSTDLNLPVGADGKVFVDPVGTGKQ